MNMKNQKFNKILYFNKMNLKIKLKVKLKNLITEEITLTPP
jgi:hypothetical protein